MTDSPKPARKRARKPTRAVAKRIGHPPLCTPDVAEAIANNLRLRMTRADACTLAGISESSFYNWQDRANTELERQATGLPADPDEARYVQFLESLRRVELEAKQALLERVDQASQPRRVRTLTMKREVRRDAQGNPMLNADNTPVMVVVSETIVESEEFEWRAALELLRRRHHGEWGDRVRNELGGGSTDSGRMEIPVQSVDEAALAAVEAAMIEAELLPPKESA